MRKVTKLFNIDIKSIDEAKRQIRFCFSDNKEDRMGEIVDQASWDTKNFEKNPVILFGHNADVPENVLGQGVELDLDVNGESFITAQFDEAEINPRADMVFRQLVKRTLRTVSAGFINHTFETDNDTPVLKDNELLEISVVPIPANPRAFAKGMQDGSISLKDGKYLLDTMRAESELIETQIKKQPEGLKEKDMEEVNTAIAQLTGLVSSVVESQAALIEKIDAVLPAPESDEDKATHEAKEAADKEAADKAAADQVEADRLAAEEAAKGGGDDQPGAGEGDALDPDAELTPELQAQIDAELAELEPAV